MPRKTWYTILKQQLHSTTENIKNTQLHFKIKKKTLTDNAIEGKTAEYLI